MKVAVAIDIETTGLDPAKHAITEIAGVCFNIETGEIHSFWKTYVNPEDKVWSQYCLNLHRDWLAKVLLRVQNKDMDGYHTYEGEPPILPIGQAIDKFKWWYQQTCRQFNSDQKIVIVGKNFGRFDWRFLNANGIADTVFPVRSFDPAILFLRPDDERPPELKDCLLRAGIDRPVTHSALQDCNDVAECLVKGLQALKAPEHIEARYKQTQAAEAAIKAAEVYIQELQGQNETLQKRLQDIEAVGALAYMRDSRIQIQQAYDVQCLDMAAMKSRYMQTCEALGTAHAQLEQAKSKLLLAESSVVAITRLHDEKAEELYTLQNRLESQTLAANAIVLENKKLHAELDKLREDFEENRQR